MVLGLRIGFLLCFVSGLLLSVVLFFKDASLLWKNRHASFWEITASLFFSIFSICQVGLLLADIVTITITFTTDTEPYWLDLVIPCTLQLFVGTNLTWTLRGFNLPQWVIWLAYGSIVFLTPAIAFRTRDNFVYEYALLSCVTIASLVSLALWCDARQTHLLSGQRNLTYQRWLMLFIGVNAVAASCQMCGAIVFYSLSLADRNISNLRQSILLACILAQVVNMFALCMSTIKHRVIEPIRRLARSRNSDIEGAVRLDSL